MIQGKYLYEKDELSEVYRIRKEVFVEEQGTMDDFVQDELDKDSIHVLVFNGSESIATGRLYIHDEYYKLGRIAVLKQYRGQQYGDFVVRMLLDKAFMLGAETVHISSQLKAVPFYKKIGFQECGEPFMDGTIEHLPMSIKKSNLCTGCQK